jgi:hypothetical protein
MQRAAASPGSSPSTPPEPSGKRQRLSNGSYQSTPASTPRSDSQLVEDALASEERKRVEALEKEAANRGETKWYLSIKEPAPQAAKSPLRVVSAGYSTLDADSKQQRSADEEEDDTDSRSQIHGRRSFGNFNRKIEVSKDVFMCGSRLFVCRNSKTQTARHQSQSLAKRTMTMMMTPAVRLL